MAFFGDYLLYTEVRRVKVKVKDDLVCLSDKLVGTANLEGYPASYLECERRMSLRLPSPIRVTQTQEWTRQRRGWGLASLNLFRFPCGLDWTQRFPSVVKMVDNLSGTHSNGGQSESTKQRLVGLLGLALGGGRAVTLWSQWRAS